ncbi:MAG: DUF6151 family protein [Parvularculaceae bacterium]
MAKDDLSKSTSIRCECGAFELAVDERGVRLACYCADCRAFARWLDRDGALDACGGTGIVQARPDRIRIVKGAERLAGLRLSSKGVLRWYTSCCRSPVGNTAPTGDVPFVGLIVAGLAAPARDAAFGPVRHVAFPEEAACAPGAAPPKARFGDPGVLILKFVARVLAARLAGAGKRNPFFDAGTGAPVATPRTLTSDERAALAAREAA